MLPTAADLWIDPVFRNPAVGPVRKPYLVQAGEMKVQALTPGYGWSDRPILRGARYWSGEDHFLVSWEIAADGSAEELLFYSGARTRKGEEGVLYREWLLGMVLDALSTINRVRAAAGVPEAEYGLEMELHSIGAELSLATWAEGGFQFAANRIEPQPLMLPRIGIRGIDSFPLILRLVFRDVLNAAGLDLGNAALTVDLSEFTS
jgi:hypothetical protein